MSTISQKISPAQPLVSLFEQSREALNQGSSPLLNRMREVSMKRFAQAGIPDFKTEDYKYTNLKPAFEKSYKQELVRELEAEQKAGRRAEQPPVVVDSP